MIKDIDNFIESILGGFNLKQRKVVLGRFGLKTAEKATLQEIGDELGITRERVRQIEEDSIKKIAPKIQAEASSLLDFSKAHLVSFGGVRRDDEMINDIIDLEFNRAKTKNLEQKLKFVFLVGGTPFYSKENDDYHAFWYVDDSSKKKFLDFVKEATSFLKTKDESPELVSKSFYEKCKEFSSNHYSAIPKHFGVNIFGDFGLRDWPEIEPKTIRDKIYLVLRKNDNPLHFSDIAKLITKTGIDKKTAHLQTVHNELIKDDRFVLVGRGVYGLKERGFEPGTVREVIAKILKQKGPLASDRVVSFVNEMRFLKENTILLSLQNRRFFKRLEDGRYNLKEV